MAKSKSFNLICLYENVPANFLKKIYLIKTEVLTFTKFVDDNPLQKNLQMCSRNVYILSQ